MSNEALQTIAANTGGTVTAGRKTLVLTVNPDRVSDACSKVASMPGFYHLSTITGIDLGEQIAVIYHFWQGKAFISVRTLVPKTDLRVPSITPTIPAALLYEAEVKDLLGVVFEGNPFMGRKLLLPDNYPADAPPPLRREADPEKIRKMLGM